MMIAQRPTWRRTATFWPVVGALLVALVACGTPAATTRSLGGDAPGALAPTAVSYPVRDTAVPPFAAIGDAIPAVARTPAQAHATAPIAQASSLDRHHFLEQNVWQPTAGDGTLPAPVDGPPCGPRTIGVCA